MLDVTYPPVDWTTDSFALTYKMLEVLEEYDGLRRTIRAGERETATGKKKADAHRDIAEKVLHNIPQYSALVATDQVESTMVLLSKLASPKSKSNMLLSKSVSE